MPTKPRAVVNLGIAVNVGYNSVNPDSRLLLWLRSGESLWQPVPFPEFPLELLQRRYPPRFDIRQTAPDPSQRLDLNSGVQLDPFTSLVPFGLRPAARN